MRPPPNDVPRLLWTLPGRAEALRCTMDIHLRIHLVQIYDCGHVYCEPRTLQSLHLQLWSRLDARRGLQ